MKKLLEELYREISLLNIDYYDDENASSWQRIFHIIGSMQERQRQMIDAMGLSAEDIEMERLSRVTPRGGLSTMEEDVERYR